MAQSPHSTEYDAMPKNAIDTGLVDCELPPAEMPVQLMTYMAHGFVESSKPSPVSQAMPENPRKTILNELLDETGHDFSQYKADSVNCRIERRMAVLQLEMIDEYVKYLQEDPAEKKALLGELLIGVTNFFRDPEIFKALEKKIIPQLFAKRPADDVVRVWSQGCSTGEEAYSLAILLMEHMNTLEQNYRVQIFATDIDSSAITTARAGLYPASIAVDISPERLARYRALREADYRRTIGLTDGLVRGFSLDLPGLGHLRGGALSVFDGLLPFKNRLVRATRGIA
jgi:two-component system CheB/CheR fusion protein